MTDTIETIGDAPAWLDDAGRANWNLIAPELRRAGLLTPAEEAVFARYCDHVARWLRLREKVNIDGETYVTTSKHGSIQRINPDFTAMMQIESSMEPLEDRFALSPLMRFKLKQIRANAEGDAPRNPYPQLPYESEGGENNADFAVAATASNSPFGILN